LGTVRVHCKNSAENQRGQKLQQLNVQARGTIILEALQRQEDFFHLANRLKRGFRQLGVIRRYYPEATF
jgi:hypothetical protein